MGRRAGDRRLLAEYGLAVELDGRTWHERRAAFERDRRRDRALQLRGLRPIRFTDRDMEDVGAVVDTLSPAD